MHVCSRAKTALLLACIKAVTQLHSFGCPCFRLKQDCQFTIRHLHLMMIFFFQVDVCTLTGLGWSNSFRLGTEYTVAACCVCRWLPSKMPGEMQTTTQHPLREDIQPLMALSRRRTGRAKEKKREVKQTSFIPSACM